jgi:hypothetical protein
MDVEVPLAIDQVVFGNPQSPLRTCIALCNKFLKEERNEKCEALDTGNTRPSCLQYNRYPFGFNPKALQCALLEQKQQTINEGVLKNVR